jgi:hypothetical protein
LGSSSNSYYENHSPSPEMTASCACQESSQREEEVKQRGFDEQGQRMSCSPACADPPGMKPG